MGTPEPGAGFGRAEGAGLKVGWDAFESDGAKDWVEHSAGQTGDEAQRQDRGQGAPGGQGEEGRGTADQEADGVGETAGQSWSEPSPGQDPAEHSGAEGPADQAEGLGLVQSVVGQTGKKDQDRASSSRLLTATMAAMPSRSRSARRKRRP